MQDTSSEVLSLSVKWLEANVVTAVLSQFEFVLIQEAAKFRMSLGI